MKNRFLICALVALCCALSSCIYDDEPECCPSEKIAVEIRISPENPDHITRSTDENMILNLNFYLCNGAGAVVLHRYQTDATLRFECLPGDYTVYVVANAHTDMGNPTVEILENYTTLYSPKFDDLVMTAKQRITIPAQSGTVELPSLEVRRAVARIDYDITVDESVFDIVIHSVQAMNLPVLYHPFVEGFRPQDFLDDETMPTVGNGSAVQGSFYMLPNCQGVRSSITAPEQKNPDNAPADATCLHIRALRGSKVLDYYVYLGENDTSDFNVRPNTVHSLHIRIFGDCDLRLRQYALDVTMTTGSVQQDGFMLDRLDGELNVRLSGYYEDMQVQGVLSLDKGDAAGCLFDSEPAHTSQQYDLGNGMWCGSVVYAPEILTRDNAHLKFTLTVSDKYGEVGRYSFEYTFAYVVQVYRTWNNGPRNVCGRIESKDALRIVEYETISALYDAVYCTSEPIALNAVPDASYHFDCWCISPNHSGVVSYNATCTYDPVYGPKVLYLYFEPNVPALNVSFRQDRTEVSAYDRAILNFTIEQSGYKGTYTIKVEGMPTFFRNLYMDEQPVAEYTVNGSGTYALRLRPEAVGENFYTVTVTDENGTSRSFSSSVQGIKTVSYFSLNFSKIAGPGLDCTIECTYPVPEDLALTVKPTVQIVDRTGTTTVRTYEMAVLMEAGCMKGRETLYLDLTPGTSFEVSSVQVVFPQSASNNGMVEYAIAS